MNIDKVKQLLQEDKGLALTLGMEFFSTPESDTCKATMKVDERNRQPFGFLSGGATLALAENLAGVGSLALCPNDICVGINVSGNHVKAVAEGDTVTAIAHLISKGRLLHVWRVDIYNEAKELISEVNVTNYVIIRNNK